MLSATHFPDVCAAQSVICHRKAHLSTRAHIQFCMPPFRPSSHPESVVDDTAVFSGNPSFGSAVDLHSRVWSHTYTPGSRATHAHSNLLELHTPTLLLGPPFSNTSVTIEGAPLEEPFSKQIADDYALPFIPSIFAGRCSKLAISAILALTFLYEYIQVVQTSTTYSDTDNRDN